MNIAEARARARDAKRLNAFITMTDEEGPGEVVAVKDLIDVRGTPTSAGSTVLPMDLKTSDAPLVGALREWGCVVIGKTNLHEWAFGSTNINPHYGTVLNPRDETRISGGSSGGSAAAVVASLCDWAIGTDTGGSIRVPASLCGAVGFKPTLGTIDTTGVLPLSRSLDTIGSLAMDVKTATRGVEMMARKEGWTPTETPELGDLRLAVPSGWVADVDDTVAEVWHAVATGLPEVRLPPLARLTKGCLDLMYAEAGAYHRKWLAECPGRYGDDILARLYGTFKVSGADYFEALSARGEIRAAVEGAMDGFDAILVPASASIAPFIGRNVNTEPLTRFTRAFNYTGQPVFSLPACSPGLPVGIQVVGRVGRDSELARIALGLEHAWSTTR